MRFVLMPEQAAVEVDDRAARAARHERRGVLDRARHATAARSAERASRPLTKPSVTRGPWPFGLPRATTGVPMAGASDADSSAAAEPVSTSRTARSPSVSTPRMVASAWRPSANVTPTSSPWRLWAFVSTRFGPITTPEPPRQRFPMPTTEGPIRSAMPPISVPSSRRLVMSFRPVPSRGHPRVTL